MRLCFVPLALTALLLLAPEAQAQFLTFDNEGQFLLTVDDTTLIDFEEVSDTDAITVSDQNGEFTRQDVHFQSAELSGNPGFAQIVGRDLFQDIGLGDYNLGSGDFAMAVAERPLILSMDFTDVDPLGVGFRVDSRVGVGALAITVRTTLNNLTESFEFDVDTAASNETFFGFVGTDGRQILDVTVTGATGSPTAEIAFDSVVSAHSVVPAPASLPLFGTGLVALGIVLRRKRVHLG
jgi:hypothetical protein